MVGKLHISMILFGCGIMYKTRIVIEIVINTIAMTKNTLVEQIEKNFRYITKEML